MSAEMMMQAAGSGLALSLLTLEAALGDPDLLAAWRARLGGVHRANRLYASPEWFEKRWRAFPEAEMRLGVLRDGTGELLGFCPLVIKPISERFTAANRAFAATKLGCRHLGERAPTAPLPRAVPAAIRRNLRGPPAVPVYLLPSDPDRELCLGLPPGRGEPVAALLLVIEPRRLWRRYLVNNPIFVTLILLQARGCRGSCRRSNAGRGR